MSWTGKEIKYRSRKIRNSERPREGEAHARFLRLQNAIDWKRLTDRGPPLSGEDDKDRDDDEANTANDHVGDISQ